MPNQITILEDENRLSSSRVVVQTGRADWTLRDVATVLFRRKWMILGLFMAIACATVALAWLLPNRYQSRMRILVRNTRADAVITPDRTNSATSGEVTETQINSEIALLSGKDLLEQVIRQSGLDKQATPSLWDASGVPSIEKSVRRMEKDLEIKPVKKADLIEVSYTADSPELAALVLRNLGSLYLEKHLTLHRPPGAHEFFQTQAEQYNEHLREAEARLSAFQQQNNFIALDQEKQLNLQKMADAQSRFLEAVAAVNEATGRIAKLQQQLSTLAPRVATQSRSLPNQYSVERLSTMLVELQNRRTQLLSKFQPDDRFVKEVEQQIKDTSEALDRAMKMTSVEQSSDLNPLKQTLETELSKARLELAGQQARRDDLAKQVTLYRGILSRLEGATNEHADLARRVKESEENYQLYTLKQEEARIADALDQKKITNVSIAEMPVEQHLPVTPNRLLTLALGLFLALFVSVGGALFAELLRDTVHTPRELETLTSVPVLATIPKGAVSTIDFVAAADEGTESLTNARHLRDVRSWRRAAQ